MGRAGLGAAEVWVAPPCSVSDVVHLLNAAERGRLADFRFELDAKSYASAHALVRLALSAAEPDVAPSAWSFRTLEFGKPAIARKHGGEERLRFNLSHTRGLVAAATLMDAEVGVDVEAVGTWDVAQELRERVLSPLEARALDALPHDRRAARFFSIWSLKESYIKARGLGLRLPLKEISFDFDGSAELGGARLVAVPAGERDRTAIRAAEAPAEQPSDWTVELRAVGEPLHALAVTAAHADGAPAKIHISHVDLARWAKSAR